jgi:hypothetical protein
MSMTAAWNQTAGHRHWNRRRCALHVALTFDSSGFEYDFEFNSEAGAGLTPLRAPKTPKRSGRAAPHPIRATRDECVEA